MHRAEASTLPCGRVGAVAVLRVYGLNPRLVRRLFDALSCFGGAAGSNQVVVSIEDFNADGAGKKPDRQGGHHSRRKKRTPALTLGLPPLVPSA